MAILFISHDLGVIAEMCESVLVMYAGRVVEAAPADDLFFRPQHPYTEGLLGSIPRAGRSKRLITIAGNVPPMDHLPPGCRFHPRCVYAVAGRCDGAEPELAPLTDVHSARCARVGRAVARRRGGPGMTAPLVVAEKLGEDLPPAAPLPGPGR